MSHPSELPWLANAELEMRLALESDEYPDYLVAIFILIAYASAANRWLDDIAARQPSDAERVQRLWSLGGMAWEHLDERTHQPLIPLLAVAKRLRGLR